MYELIASDQIRDGVDRLAADIADFYASRELTIIGVMTGSVVLLADLIRLINRPLHVGVVQVRSYRGGSTRPGPLSIHADLIPDLRDRDVLVLDDIFDSGNTLFELVTHLDSYRPRSIRTAVLLRKDCERQIRMEPNHVVFDIPDKFVVGYGLDYRDEYRNLPHVAALEPQDMNGAT